MHSGNVQDAQPRIGALNHIQIFGVDTVRAASAVPIILKQEGAHYLVVLGGTPEC